MRNMLAKARASMAAVVLAVLAGTLCAVGGVGSDAASATPGVTVQQNIQYGVDNGPVLLDAYLPASTPIASPAVIFVHGGAWTGGDKAEWATDAADLVAKTGWPAFSVNYVLNSATPYYNEYWDVSYAVNWVKSNATKYGIDPARIALVGGSAGGHLAMLAATYGSGPSSASGRVKAVVSWSGISDTALVVTDLGCAVLACNTTTQWLGGALQNYEKVLLPLNVTRWTSTSPIANVDPTDPPTLLISSAKELVPLDQLTTMATKLIQTGVPVSTAVYPGDAHALSYNAKAWPLTLAFLQQQLTGP